MSKTLKISPDLSLPLDAVTQTFAILAKRGVGKTYTGSVMAEEMLAAGQQVIVLDPTGAWFGLTSSADGRGPAPPPHPMVCYPRESGGFSRWPRNIPMGRAVNN